MIINEKEFNQWIAALRSGEYTQAKGTLQYSEGFCCLGVACEVLIPQDKKVLNEEGFLLGYEPDQQESPEWLQDISNELWRRTGTTLISLNDTLGLDFNAIADCLEMVFVYKVLDD